MDLDRVNAHDLDAFLEDVKQEVEEKEKDKDRKNSADPSSDHDDRSRNGDRNGRADRDRGGRDSRGHRDDRYSDSRRDRDDRDGRGYRGRDRHVDRYEGGGRDRDDRYGGESYRNRDRSKDRRRDRSRQRSTKDADSDNDRDRYGRDGGARYSGGRRDRSRSPRRDRDDRDRVDRENGNGSRKFTPEPSEDDRDKRTIFVQQITARADTRHLRRFFEVVGPVVEAQIVKDRVTGRSKGVGYVEFKDEESVPKALELTGQKLKGVPIIAQLTEAEKNRAARNAAESGPSAANSGIPFHRLYVGNIHFSITEDDLKVIFEPYGELEQVTLQRDEKMPTRSKGYGFVQFLDPADAKRALNDMNGFELAGRNIRVGLGSDKFTTESTANLLRHFPNQTESRGSQYQGSTFSGAGGRGAYAGGSGGHFDRGQDRDSRGVTGASALDDSDMAGVNFRTVDRAKLMRNLARNEVDIPVKVDTPRMAQKKATVIDQPMPSRCVKIENAFDPAKEQADFGDKWKAMLEKEVKLECSKKYGPVVHIAAAADSDGDIYVKFDAVAAAKKSFEGLNGRTFNHRTIRASYFSEAVYNTMYPAAASK